MCGLVRLAFVLLHAPAVRLRDKLLCLLFTPCLSTLAHLFLTVFKLPGGGGCSTSPGGLRTIPELIALAVNVAHSSGVAEVGLKMLVTT